ncbi:hypothetical protein NPX13_g4829 [Xylaria arbuscula]|uniref:chitinase n=1 Tax=Xylaria arbuscula TaxID=114810 RepID=A0A9W8TLK0_9PEZI|nr:hypothetical protein NPX13_g4829 [Xylaria arbuscula]
MKAFSSHLLFGALLVVGSLASYSDVGLSYPKGDSTDVDKWLVAANRVRNHSLQKCPAPCGNIGDDSSETRTWFLMSDPEKLAACNETMLLNMMVRTEVDMISNTHPAIRACTANYDSDVMHPSTSDDRDASLRPTANQVLEKLPVRIHQPEVSNDDKFSIQHLLSAGHQIARRLSLQPPSCANNVLTFGYAQSSVIGLFAGPEVHQQGITLELLNNLLTYAERTSLSRTTIVQLCGATSRGADYNIGVIATSSRNLQAVRTIVKTWAEGECVSQPEAGEEWMIVTLRVPHLPEANPTNSSQVTSQSRLRIRADCKTTKVNAGDGCYAVAERCGVSEADLSKYNRADLCKSLIADETVCCSSGSLPSTLPQGNSDGTCKTRSVVSGDSCGSLASKCGISAADFTKVNPKEDLCANLVVGQKVCCSDGKFPDLKPKPDTDGNCATYTTQKDDSCSAIAAARGLTAKDVEDFNKKTWGWNGCESLLVDYKMCVSEGNPPLPQSVPNAVCGPTVEGTEQPKPGTDLATLNPCPLNVCCNIWGQCGTTDDFCTEKESKSGAPGTSGAKNGCISNCGRDVIKGSPPAQKIKVAYFEAWNHNRKCLTMDVDQIDTSAYTHIHFAFADITPDFQVVINDKNVKEQFELFKGLTDVKRILSFGGWDFSTAPGTFQILREAVKPANLETFKNNVIAFVNEHDLDGVDLDWEYPGAPDIPSIPSDDPESGMNYYKFLSSFKSSVGSSKTISFAAPASYWYLRAFPIDMMAKEIDYIIYLTYDLHGQWDYGNKWTSSGCDTGNCLRSHVNETETKDALALITKAGAPSNKVVVGVASYGRSFKMAEAGCTSEGCKFTGSPQVSNAAKGRCTDTAGYLSNAEIQEIIATGKVNKQWKGEGSNMMVYNDTEWVAYMDDDTKMTRAEFYDSYNFAGTTDWAVDLQYFDDGSELDSLEDAFIDENYWPSCPELEDTLEELQNNKGALLPHCVEKYLIDAQVAVMTEALEKYQDLIEHGYDAKFKIYEDYVKEQIPDQLNNFMASDKVDKYFTCSETKDIRCCKDCSYATCLEGCTKGNDCVAGRGSAETDTCPKFEFTLDLLDPKTVPNATFTLNDADGFFKDLEDTWGIDKSWIKFGDRFVKGSNGCQYAGDDVKECIKENSDWFWNFPLVDNDKVEIFNPKDLIGASYPKAEDLRNRIMTLGEVAEFDELILARDTVDASSLPAFSMEEAVNSMDKIVEQAKEIEKREREEFILNFLTGLLFFIPFVGEAAGAAGLVSTRALLRLIGAAGDAGLAVYDVVQNPDNAFTAVFSYLLGAGLGRAGFKRAAGSRRGLTMDDYKSLGNIKGRLDMVGDIRGAAVCKL